MTPVLRPRSLAPPSNDNERKRAIVAIDVAGVRWLRILVVISVALLLVTFASYALEGSGALSRLLFRFGLGGENNVGAWWSGMLLFLAAALAFDGYANRAKALRERRGWLALAAALLLLSFDEVASLHEYLANLGLGYLVPLGALGLALVGYALWQLRAAGVSARTLALLLAAFALLALVPLQEIVQHTYVWTDSRIYGLRAMVEEGTEILAMLLLIVATRPNSAALLAHAGEVLAVARWRTHWLAAGALLLPVLTAATFVLPYPGGPADWLGAVVLLACALSVVRSLLLEPERPSAGPWLLLGFYVMASAATNAVPLDWDPVVLGRPVGLRGVTFMLLCAAAVPVLRLGGRRMGSVVPALATLAAGIGAMRPESQLLWCAAPPAIALWLYAVETRHAAISAPAASAPRLAVAAATPDSR